jgi:hypothetical protein
MAASLIKNKSTAVRHERHDAAQGLGFFASARQLVRQGGGVTVPRAGRGCLSGPMAAHQLAIAYQIWVSRDDPSTAGQARVIPAGGRGASHLGGNKYSSESTEICGPGDYRPHGDLR